MRSKLVEAEGAVSKARRAGLPCRSPITAGETAIAGEAQIGRVVMAGPAKPRAGRPIGFHLVGGTRVAHRHARPDYDEATVSAAMKKRRSACAWPGTGKGRDRVLTCDLTTHVANGDYRPKSTS